MKRFIFTLAALFLLYLVIGFSVLFVRLVLWQKDVDALYTITPDQTWLCVGASHVGASFPESCSDTFHYKLLWLHSTHPAETMMMLQELDRRGQLKNIKQVVTQFGPLSAKGKESSFLPCQETANWLRMLPVGWRYPELCPNSAVSILLTLVQNLHKIELKLNQSLSEDRKSWFEQSEEFRSERLATYVQMHFEGYEQGVDVAGKYIQQYLDIDEYCKKRGVRLLLFAAPAISAYRAKMPDLLKRRTDVSIDRLRQAGIPVYDCRESYPDELFADPVHLAPVGARKFVVDFMSWMKRQG